MIGDLTYREDELGGKTLLIVGLGRIGGRLARLAKAFDMTVIGFRRDPSTGAGAALDCTDPEPPAAASPLWAMANVPITPHTGGETTQYEKNVNEILLENLNRMWRAETALLNQIV